MSPNGRRAWRAAAKKLRRKLGRRWRSPEAKWSGKRWSELVPDIAAHRAHVTGAWFRRHGCTDQGLQTLDAPNMVRVYVGLWGAVDGDGVEYAVKPKPFTARSLVGMTMGARKRAAWYEALRTSYDGDGGPISNRKLRLCLSVLTAKVLSVTVPIEWRLEVRAKYRIGQNLRPCVGCLRCQCRSAFDAWPELGEELAKDHPTCDGSGVLPAKRQLCLGCSWCGTPPKEGATRFTQCDGSGVLPARKDKT